EQQIIHTEMLKRIENRAHEISIIVQPLDAEGTRAGSGWKIQLPLDMYFDWNNMKRSFDELKNNRASKKGQDAEHPQIDKSNQQDKDTREGPNLQQKIMDGAKGGLDRQGGDLKEERPNAFSL
ncbi:hypothetical protein ACJX0J_017994, partial [Zea mays]